MWKCGEYVFIHLSLSSNSGTVEICLYCLYLVTLEVWKCGNMSSLSLFSNTGSVEMWKCGNMSSLSLSSNSGSVQMRKYVFIVFI